MATRRVTISPITTVKIIADYRSPAETLRNEELCVITIRRAWRRPGR